VVTGLCARFVISSLNMEFSPHQVGSACEMD
jgi:hypothetical protein